MERPDVVLVGGGIMSATLGAMLRGLEPDLTLHIYESLPSVARESTNAWNNAGTGHAALCELNYTPEDTNGHIDIAKALRINDQFEKTKHYWGHLVEQGIIGHPWTFIHKCPHMSFVWGEDNVVYLRRRHQAMVQNHLFETMEFTTNPSTIEEWAPLLLAGRPTDEPLAATRVEAGTDVDFGSLTSQLIAHLVKQDGVELFLNTRVTDLSRENGAWRVKLAGGESVRTKFVFLGAGGGALPLLQKSRIPEAQGYGGFPASGKFLVCKDPKIVEQHAAKVYGKAAVGAPPMSVPHLDLRVIDGKRSLLFGPYAGFSPNYLKSGSFLDMFKTVRPDNLWSMLGAGYHNLDLTKYLVNEVRKDHENRCETLREFYPEAKNGDWKLLTAGQRVQVIKRDPKTRGKLEFGTEVVAARDGSLATVLGASPGASVVVPIMLEVLERSFAGELAIEAWKNELADMVPAYGIDLAEDERAFRELGDKAARLLQLN